MSPDALNLSRRPFVNSRPVTRTAIALWLLSILLLAGNAFLFWSYLAGSKEKREEIRQVEAQIRAGREGIARLQAQVAGLDLGRQNEEVAFLNDKIAERTFSWSLLFDRLAEVLPMDVRLNHLTPRGVIDERLERRRRGVTLKRQSDRVVLTMVGDAKNDEALLQFVDNLFAHPAFAEPDLSRESRELTGLIRFDLQVGYRPAQAGAAVGGALPARRPRIVGSPGILGAAEPAGPAGPPGTLHHPLKAMGAPGTGGGERR
ncbi:MAG TPA: hypothetical protein VOA87_12515 [Thermoanaerobaculia bacterium]|nr:hypothetical protein [Thermoanaerobaculia bacterium]